ncbi:Histidinol dehydrogenase [Buchnera aphidicola (Sipha maydis)]|uniref:histidinol dehydrogenase n=1 Tax=Buchnera aphidicola TaxID=9 RepID=UPI00346470EF
MKVLNKIIFWNDISHHHKKNILKRSIFNKKKNIEKDVLKIVQDIFLKKDAALKYYTSLLDNFFLKNIKISKKKILKSEKYMSNEFKKSIFHAIKNISYFHSQQRIKNLDVEVRPGIRCEQIIKPINSVGLYIPGGLSPLFSTLLMLAIPAKISGCKNISICSPPPISKKILYLAKIFKIYDIYQIGGAQAISALAFGTESVKKVDKIFGPGNEYVTEAKRQVSSFFNTVSIDMLAGPSELLIIADSYANSDFIAADLLSQAEHGKNSQVFLVTDSEYLAIKVLKKLKYYLYTYKNIEIIKHSLKKSHIIVTKNLEQCVKISNKYAPEHLIINTKNYRELLKNIINAGSIFLGQWSPETAGDYASGTNHVLPTYGFSKSCSGISVSDFSKKITVQELTKKGFYDLSSVLQNLSCEEGMLAHKNAVDVRLSLLKE